MIKHIKENKEKLFTALLFILVFLFFLTNILKKEITNLDELWNYNIARNIAKGLIPYKDISLITTPLLPFIEALILKITVNELLTFRIINAVLITSIIFITYKIFNELNNKKTINAFLTIPLVFIIKDELFLDYNFFALFLTLMVTYLEVKFYKEKNLTIDFIIGILGGCAFCTKQTVGAIICIGIITKQIVKLLKNLREKNSTFQKENNWNSLISPLILRVTGILIPILILIAYLCITKSFNDFLSYTFLAINTFNNKIPYITLIQSKDLLIKILSILLPLFVIADLLFVLFYKEKQKDIYIKISTLTIYSLTLMIIQYPIADRTHFILSNYLIMVLLLFIITELMMKAYKKINIKFKRFVLIVSETFLLLLIITMLVLNIKSNYKEYISANKNIELKYYKNLIVPEYTIELYNQIMSMEVQYEKQGMKVNILDSNAVVFHIPMDKYIKNYDMFNKGNLGKDGEDGIINTINNSEKQVYLIKKDAYTKNWQNPSKVTEYVKENLKKVGQIGIYDIYEKEN